MRRGRNLNRVESGFGFGDSFMGNLTRRAFLKYGAAGGAALFLPWTFDMPVASAAVGGKLARFVEPLPLPGAGIVVATPKSVAAGLTRYAFSQRQINRQLHPQLPPTPLWAYDDGSGLAGQAGSFGMAVVAQTGAPIAIDFTNELPRSYADAAWIPVDTRLTPLGSEVRVMTHLHGGFVAADSDGNPAITPDGFGFGDVQSVYYPNQGPQNRASLLWFHDHGLGATRLNVFAGLAAAYLIRDEYDTGQADNANGLPSGPYEIPLVIQDRQFRPDGTFLYPTSDISGTTWIGEYFGDVMLVNGKVWPYLTAEPRLYRFRILNGCNARIMNLHFGGARMWQIGAEGGMWDVPVSVSRLTLAPAERADVLVDFSQMAGQTTQLKNTNPLPPVSTPAPSLTQVMEIRVANTTPVPATIPATLVGGAKASLPAPSPARRRFITLNEAAAETSDWVLTLNATGFMDGSPTEAPSVGTIEDWYYVNLTPDTHPMHMHLVTFQVVGRVPFDAGAYTAAAGSGELGVPGGTDPTPFATGPMIPADPSERGFKDTVKANPGYFTIVRAKFDLPSGVSAPQRYVHHCHIVEHEDNDMMRAYDVVP
jgi:spore coat protein A, manganese oxidase